FRRFEVMRHWRDVDHLAFETFVSPDGLHMNDWGYACLAKGLGNAIAEAAKRPIMSAGALSPVMPQPAAIPPTLFIPLHISSTRSWECSRPAENLITPSLMPSSARCSGVNR